MPPLFFGAGKLINTALVFAAVQIEQNKFQGFHGNDEFPEFLRRMNGLGHITATSIFPADKFDESEVFREITTSMCQLGC